MAHGKWAQPGVPHKGWVCVDFEDLGEPGEICEMCESAEIRFVHLMEHEEYPDTLRCGCVCAEHMGGDYIGPRRRESDAKNLARRRAKWLRHEWKISRGGSQYLRVDNFVLIMYELDRGGWMGIIKDQLTGQQRQSRRCYLTEDEFKLAAFDAMVRLKKKWRGE